MPLAERAAHTTKMRIAFFNEEICLKERVSSNDIAIKRKVKLRRGKRGEELFLLRNWKKT
jgi:hypothetical protein